MFRRIRIAILLVLLLFIGLGELLDRYYSNRWDRPFVVALYPINADGSESTERYVNALSNADFVSLERFFERESHEFGVTLERPIQITLAPPLLAKPPLPPTRNPTVLAVMMWSLHFRWWAWLTPPKPPGSTPRIRIFMLYYEPKPDLALDHSTGLAKGHLGIAHLFASTNQAGSNQTVIAHELLHTLNATDKYDPETSLPRYPDGFAEPASVPRLPQRFAELMGGRIPISATQASIPESLDAVVIGPATAAEIGWIKR